jgi:hypothetical protein
VKDFATSKNFAKEIERSDYGQITEISMSNPFILLGISPSFAFNRSRYYPWCPTYRHSTDESAAEIKRIKKMANASDLEGLGGKSLAVSKFFAKLC